MTKIVTIVIFYIDINKLHKYSSIVNSTEEVCLPPLDPLKRVFIIGAW